MSTNVNAAGAAGALDKMAAGLASGMQNRDQVALEKQEIGMKMKQNQHKQDTGSMEAEVDRVTAENKKLTGEIQRDKTFRSLKAFTADGNVRHLNGVIRDEATKSGISRFSTIDRVADQKLVADAGLSMEQIYNPENYGEETGSDSNRNYIKAVMQDGTETLMSVFDYKKAVGYFKRLTDEETAAELKAAEAKKKASGKTGVRGEWEKKADLVADQGVDTKKNAVKALYTDMQLGNKGGGEVVANEARQSLDEEYGGSFSTNFDPSDEVARAKVYPRIREIERFGGVKLDVGTKKALVNIGKLVSLGEPLSELKEEETGLYDAFTFKLEKYWSDEGGSESAASFAAFRNVIRHTLYGSALTDSEISAFDEQLGTTNKKLGPLLKESATALREVQGQIDVLVALNDPYVVAYRMGINMDKLEDIQYNLRKTIDYLERKSQGKPAVDPRKSREERVKAMGSML